MTPIGPVILRHDSQTGLYVVWTPIGGLFHPGIWSQGRTPEGAQKSIESAVALYLKDRCTRRQSLKS